MKSVQMLGAAYKEKVGSISFLFWKMWCSRRVVRVVQLNIQIIYSQPHNTLWRKLEYTFGFLKYAAWLFYMVTLYSRNVVKKSRIKIWEFWGLRNILNSILSFLKRFWCCNQIYKTTRKTSLVSKIFIKVLHTWVWNICLSSLQKLQRSYTTSMPPPLTSTHSLYPYPSQAEQDMEGLTENAEEMATEEGGTKEEEFKGGRLHYRVGGGGGGVNDLLSISTQFL